KRKFDRLIQKIGTRLMFSKKTNKFLVLDTYGDDHVLAEMQVYELPEDMKCKTMQELQLPTKYGIQILMINHNGTTNTHITKEDKIFEGDRVILFGRGKVISEIFNQHILL
ncbi:MAG: TrkA C-terminal domain-containing protein, partial [Eubacterium sp.]